MPREHPEASVQAVTSTHLLSYLADEGMRLAKRHTPKGSHRDIPLRQRGDNFW